MSKTSKTYKLTERCLAQMAQIADHHALASATAVIEFAVNKEARALDGGESVGIYRLLTNKPVEFRHEGDFVSGVVIAADEAEARGLLAAHCDNILQWQKGAVTVWTNPFAHADYSRCERIGSAPSGAVNQVIMVG